MPVVQRFFLGRINGQFTFTWNPSDMPDWNQRTVLVTASEGFDASGGGRTDMPARFVGAATITVQNIAPSSEGVAFRINVDWGEPLPIWVDVRVFDEDVPTSVP
jgi:hypothetical protein